MSNLNSTISKIQEICESNPLINTFKEGDIWDIVGNTNINYPLVWLDAQTLQHSINVGSVTYGFEIWFLDLVDKDIDDNLKIKSDQMEVAIDFTRFLKSNYRNLDFEILEETVSGNTVTENIGSDPSPDIVAGFKLSLNVIVKGSGSVCKNIFSV